MKREIVIDFISLGKKKFFLFFFLLNVFVPEQLEMNKALKMKG